MSHLFSDFQTYLHQEQNRREEICTATKEIEHFTRKILSVMQVIHSEEGYNSIHQCCQESRVHFESVRKGYSKLTAVVPPLEYYRYNDHWKNVTTQLAFLLALIVYLESGRLTTREEFAEIVGVNVNLVQTEEFHIDLEDYLQGLLLLASELARLAVNSVTYGNYSRPVHISKFVAELNTGFRMLNLQNDFLCKRFDALKYDVQKIEEVVYDLSLRKLLPGVVEGDAAPT